MIIDCYTCSFGFCLLILQKQRSQCLPPYLKLTTRELTWKTGEVDKDKVIVENIFFLISFQCLGIFKELLVLTLSLQQSIVTIWSTHMIIDNRYTWSIDHRSSTHMIIMNIRPKTVSLPWFRGFNTFAALPPAQEETDQNIASIKKFIQGEREAPEKVAASKWIHQTHKSDFFSLLSWVSSLHEIFSFLFAFKSQKNCCSYHFRIYNLKT